jgi:methyl-accepting chemotaxis protein
MKHWQYRLVDRELQYRFLTLMLIYSAIILFFIGTTVFVPNILDMMNEGLSAAERLAAADRILRYHSWLWRVAIGLVCLLCIHSIWIFGRLIGPLNMFRLAFRKIKEGDLSFRVKLRKRDYLHKEEEAFNEMVEVFQEKWESVRNAVAGVLESLDSREQVVTQVSGRQNQDQELLENQRQHLEAMVKDIHYFRLKEDGKPKQGPVAAPQHKEQRS